MKVWVWAVLGLAVGSCDNPDPKEPTKKEVIAELELPQLDEIRFAEQCAAPSGNVSDDAHEAYEEMRNGSCEWSLSGKEVFCEAERRIVRRVPQGAVENGELTVTGLKDEPGPWSRIRIGARRRDDGSWCQIDRTNI